MYVFPQAVANKREYFAKSQSPTSRFRPIKFTNTSSLVTSGEAIFERNPHSCIQVTAQRWINLVLNSSARGAKRSFPVSFFQVLRGIKNGKMVAPLNGDVYEFLLASVSLIFYDCSWLSLMNSSDMVYFREK